MKMKINFYPINKKIKYLLLIIGLFFLVLSCYYNYSRPIGLIVMMNDPVKNNDQELTISGEVIGINKPYYSLHDEPNNINFIVKNALVDWKVSDFIAFKGKFKKEGYIEYMEGEIIWDKKIKLGISIFSFIIFIILFIFEFKKLKFHF